MIKLSAQVDGGFFKDGSLFTMCLRLFQVDWKGVCPVELLKKMTTGLVESSVYIHLVYVVGKA